MEDLKRLPWMLILLVLAIAYPLVPGLNTWMFNFTGQPVGGAMPTLFIYAILALGLNVVVGYCGLLHLGIGAFFGIGAYITGILCVKDYPFQVGFFVALPLSILGAALLAVILSAPVLRLRGDYLALVTLGFGEVLRFVLRNLESITYGTKGINPMPPPLTFWRGKEIEWTSNYLYWYFVTLAFLVAVILFLRNIERSRLGRGWVAVREDELAAACMGLNTARLKLSAFAIGAGLAGLAGSLFAFRQNGTGSPDEYSFNTSINVLCCLILGGLGNRKGVIIGVLLIYGYENIISPALDSWIQAVTKRASDVNNEVRLFGLRLGSNGSPYLTFSGWRLMIFGLVLIFVMRFRPHGLFPAKRG
jgi:branched-chain amino acid transport system permease protein